MPDPNSDYGIPPAEKDSLVSGQYLMRLLTGVLQSGGSVHVYDAFGELLKVYGPGDVAELLVELWWLWNEDADEEESESSKSSGVKEVETELIHYRFTRTKTTYGFNVRVRFEQGEASGTADVVFAEGRAALTVKRRS